jgi:hypothetical protein
MGIDVNASTNNVSIVDQPPKIDSCHLRNCLRDQWSDHIMWRDPLGWFFGVILGIDIILSHRLGGHCDCWFGQHKELFTK